MKQVKLEKGELYTPVSERIKELTKMKKEKEIFSYDMITKSEFILIHNTHGWKCEVTLTITNIGGNIEVYTGSGFKLQDNTPFGKSALMWAETIARGRACAAMGIGIDEVMVSSEEIMAAEQGIIDEGPISDISQNAADKLANKESLRGKQEETIPVGDTIFITTQKDPIEKVAVIKDPEEVFKIYSEPQLMNMGTGDKIHKILKHYNIKVVKGVSNVELRRLILKAQGKQLSTKKSKQEVEIVPVKEPEIKVDEKEITKVMEEAPEVGDPTNFLNIAIGDKTPRSEAEYIPIWNALSENLEKTKTDLEAKMKELGMMDEYKKLQTLLQRGTVEEINALINAFKEKP